MSNIKRHDGAGEGDVEAFLARVREMPAPAASGGRGRLGGALPHLLGLTEASADHAVDSYFSVI